MWLDRQQKNLYLEQFTETDKELIKPDTWMKYRETPGDNFTLAIPAANQACQEPQEQKQSKPWSKCLRGEHLLTPHKRTTPGKSQLTATTELKVMRPKMPPTTGEKNLRLTF